MAPPEVPSGCGSRVMENLEFGAILFRVALIFVAGFGVYRLALHGVARLRAQRYVTDNGAFLLTGLARWSIVLVALILAIQSFGISMQALWTAVSALLVMVAIGFVAVWSILSNLLCAVLLVVFAPFRIGDEIELIEITMKEPDKRGIRGRVLAINMLYTSLEDLTDGSAGTIRVPNNLLFQRAIRTIAGEETKSLGQSLFEMDDPD
jgi:small-conductance mechanosensitive channel